jgi:hypothetical protein
MAAAQVRAVCSRLPPSAVVHPLRELEEALGVFVIAIVRDPVGGYETCLVGSEFFDRATRGATDWRGPDWAKRRALIDSRCARADVGKSS